MMWAVLHIQLKRNLRKSLLQGQPWIYRQAIIEPENRVTNSQLCKLKDSKGDFVGWGYYSPGHPIAVRMLSFQKKPPSTVFFQARWQQALTLRTPLLDGLDTNAFRLFNGEGDLLPGLICDIYDTVAVLQFDGPSAKEFWLTEDLINWLSERPFIETIFYKPRHDSSDPPQYWPEAKDLTSWIVRENKGLYEVDLLKGQKTGFFLDQRDNRHHVKQISKDKTVLNLFSFSGGFSIAAGLGGAKSVVSVDRDQGAIHLCQKNWDLNELPSSSHAGYSEDVFDFLNRHEDKYDIVICDPPSFAKAEKHKESAMTKYIETFSMALKRTQPGGRLLLSSCSSHIHFSDFQSIVDSTLSNCRTTAQILRVSGQGVDHPFPHSFHEFRYLKFYDLQLSL